MRKEDAEIVLDKTTIFAPFPARVTEVSAEVGQAVSAGKVLTKLGSIDLVEIEAQIPDSSCETLCHAGCSPPIQTLPLARKLSG